MNKTLKRKGSRRKISAAIYLGGVLIVGVAAYYGIYRYLFYPTQEPMKRIKEASGLEYEILTAAPDSAQKPQKGQTVTVHYTGWLDDNGNLGRKFDSSLDRGQKFQFPLGQGYVISGWDLTVADMKMGEKRRVYIPSKLGYGPYGAGAAIPPHANLIFDIELFDAK